MCVFARATRAEDVCNTCLDSNSHKESPGPEAELFDTCSPWKQRSCCTSNTSYQAHGDGGGNAYNFQYDHCVPLERPPMSDKCRRHFIEDNCFYECSPNTGPWIVDEGNSYRNQRYKNIPLCADHCGLWWNDCRNDYTCKENWSTGWNWDSGFNVCPTDSTCKLFSEVFPTPQDLCEKVYPDDFKVVSSDEPCMVTWFEGEENPNDKVAEYYADAQGQTCGSGGPKLSSLLTFTELLVAMAFLKSTFSA